MSLDIYIIPLYNHFIVTLSDNNLLKSIVSAILSLSFTINHTNYNVCTGSDKTLPRNAPSTFIFYLPIQLRSTKLLFGFFTDLKLDKDSHRSKFESKSTLV